MCDKKTKKKNKKKQTKKNEKENKELKMNRGSVKNRQSIDSRYIDKKNETNGTERNGTNV